MRSLALVLALVLVAVPRLLDAQTTPAGGSIEIRGDSLPDRRITPDELAALPRVEARVRDHGREVFFSGVSLAAVLRLAGVPMDALRGRRLATYIVVEAADGYRVVLSIGEIDESLTGRTMFLANRRDGAPLSPNEGAWRLIIPGEKRASRWVRQVTALVVRRG